MATGFYEDLLGADFARLPAPVQRLHRPGAWTAARGRCDIERQGGAPARLLCRAMNFPPPGRDLPLAFTITCDGDGWEHWRRDFAGHLMQSRMRRHGSEVHERIGFTSWRHALEVAGGALVMRPLRMRVLGVPCPRFLQPRIETREWAEGTRYWFDVGVAVAWLGLRFRYRGWLELE